LKKLSTVLLFLFSCANNPTNVIDDTPDLIGVWESDTIRNDEVSYLISTQKLVTKETIKLRLTTTVSELAFNRTSYYSTTKNDSIWSYSTRQPNTYSSENWDIVNDSIYMIKVVNSGGSKLDLFRLKYKSVSPNELWIWSVSTNYDSLDCNMWTWYKCKRINE
jgi:hypothetical protein